MYRNPHIACGVCDLVIYIVVDNEIIGIIQSIFNLLPNLELKDTLDSLATKSDDSAFMVFISQLCRSVVSLHELVNQKHPPQGETETTEKEKEGDKSKK